MAPTLVCKDSFAKIHRELFASCQLAAIAVTVLGALSWSLLPHLLAQAMTSINIACYVNQVVRGRGIGATR
jgi:hypothetical protein